MTDFKRLFYILLALGSAVIGVWAYYLLRTPAGLNKKFDPEHFATVSTIAEFRHRILHDLGVAEFEQSHPGDIHAGYFAHSNENHKAVDGWGRQLRDEYYFEGMKLRINIRSAGVDGRFETSDDIMQ